MAKASLFFWLLALSVGCQTSNDSTFNPGLHLKVRIPDAQFHKGGLSVDQGGPSVSFVNRPQPVISRGESSIALSGRLSAGGVALHIQAQGDPDHWVQNAGGEDFVIPEELLFAFDFSLASFVAEDTLILLMQAVDSDGRFGPVTEVEFVISPDLPPAELLVTLAWDAPADVDLHLELPDNTIVGAKNIHSFDPPAGAPPASEMPPGGFLEFDSNQECLLDLRNQENIVWRFSSPPSGTYRVYAHLFSPCDAQVVNMISTLWIGSELTASAGAVQTPFDSRIHPSDGEAPGLLMMEFEVP